MTHVQVTVETGEWTLTVDTDAPVGGSARRGIVGPIVGNWSTDVLPPVANPTSVQFGIYDFPDFAAGQTWLPIRVGQAVSCYVDADGAALVRFQGRISAATGQNMARGGVLYTVVAADPLGDMSSSGSPKLVDVDGGIAEIFDAIQLLVEYSNLIYGGDEMFPGPADPDVHPMTFENVDALSAASTYLQSCVSTTEDAEKYGVLRYDLDPLDPTPSIDTTEVIVAEYDPRAVTDLAGALELFYDGSMWVLVPNLDYYLTHTGLVLYGANVLRNAGEWAQGRRQAINTIELQGTFSQIGGSVETVQATLPLGEAGPVTRTITSPIETRVQAEAVADAILYANSEWIEFGSWGLSGFTIAWESLSAAQVAAWGSDLWWTPEGVPLAKPFLITDIPEDWRLSYGPAVFGRLMAAQFSIELAVPSPDGVDPGVGRVRIGVTMRPIGTPNTGEGITPAELVGLSPDVTPSNLDPAIRVLDMSLVEG